MRPLQGTLEGVNSETLVVSNFPIELETNPATYSFQLEVTDQNGNVSAADVINIEIAEFSGPATPQLYICLLYTSPSPRDPKTSRMPSSA